MLLRMEDSRILVIACVLDGMHAFWMVCMCSEEYARILRGILNLVNGSEDLGSLIEPRELWKENCSSL